MVFIRLAEEASISPENLVRKVAEEGRPINLTIVPGGGGKTWYKGLYLALFTKA